MSSNKKLLLGAVAAQGAFLCIQTGQIRNIVFYHERLPSQMFSLWLAGLLYFMVAPPWIALSFWKTARRIKHGWLLDLFFFPTIWVVGWACIRVIFFAAGDFDDDGPSGWAMDPAKLLLILTILTYFVALIVKAHGDSAQE